MSKLEQLLEGVEVEWKTLGEISEIYGGLTGKNKADFENGNANYISYKNIFFNLDVKYNILETVKISVSENQHEVKYGDVLFTGSSETADEVGMSSSVTTNIDEPVYLNSFSFGVRFNEEIQLIPEFSKYLFRCKFMRTEISKTASGVTRYNVSKARFKKLQIPIPPLSVQKEIVRILDTFTALTAQLTAELTARKKQFNFYREQLLSFEVGEVEWKCLGEVTEVNTGQKPSVIFEKPKSFDYINAGTTRSGYCELSNCQGDVVTTPSRGQGGIGFVGYQPNPFWLGPLCYKINSQNVSILLNKFLFYYLQYDNKLILGLKKEGGVPAVNKSDLIKILIPIPPLEEQQRIVSILDKFDILTNSISEGLPKEIELRKQQYEYYRDLLLTFPKKENV